MNLEVKRSKINGTISIPASKSHTIRAIIIASLADGTSVLKNPLVSADALSCVDGGRALGAEITTGTDYTIKGIGGIPRTPAARIDVGNSGTSLRLMTAVAALSGKQVEFDGDNSIRQRPMLPLLTALQNLGATYNTPNGKCPFTIQGPIRGGKTMVEGVSSQFLSALLLAAPLAEGDTEIDVPLLNERPYVEITIDWLKRQNISFERKGYEWFKVYGNQKYNAFTGSIPADFSSATFALVAAAIQDTEVLIKGLDFSDSQGDKEVFSMVEKMGASIKRTNDGVLVRGGNLTGMTLDLNAIPDALPALSVLSCFAKGETHLANVPQARLKECDRIKASCTELKKMGADITELPDGLIIKESTLHAANVHGYHDHRMVMSLSIAGMNAEGTTVIDTAEAVDVTYPTFIKDFQTLGGQMELMKL